jgi:tetratricopeptide (TPR) repeat protein
MIANHTDTLSNSERVQKTRDLYERGLYLQAYTAGQVWGPLQDWPGTRARVLATRLANNLGSPRLALWLARCAYRSDPTDPEAKYFYALGLYRFRGILGAWQWLKKQADMPEHADPDIRASWLAHHGTTATLLRDFATAHDYFNRAEKITPHNAWIKVCRASARTAEDSYDEALAITREALEIRPWYRPQCKSTANCWF